MNSFQATFYLISKFTALKTDINIVSSSHSFPIILFLLFCKICFKHVVYIFIYQLYYIIIEWKYIFCYIVILDRVAAS